MATKKRKTTTRRAASRKKRAEQRLPAGLGTLFAGLLLVVLAFAAVAGLALAAALGPALRAARIEPSEVIREV